MTRLEKVLEGLNSPQDCDANLIKNAAALLKEYDEALRLMVYQYCCWDTPEIDPETEYFFNRHMSAGEAAFRVLGIENWQEVPGNFI